MAKPRLPASLVGKVAPLLAKLPFLPKKAPASPGIDEPFEDLEDASPDSDESFEPNALPGSKGGKGGAPSLDFGAILRSFLGNQLLIGIVAAVLIVLLAIALVAVFADIRPPKAEASALPMTDEGRTQAKRFILPRDPAFDLTPPMEREPRDGYTEEEMRQFAPAHDFAVPPGLSRRVDAIVDGLLEAAP